MQQSVKERLIIFIKEKGLSQGKFEKVVGLANGYVNNIRKSITEEKLQQIARYFPDLNKAWLLTGEGEMLTSQSPPDEPQRSFTQGRPYYDVDFLGGFDAIFNDQTTRPLFNIDFPPLNKPGVIWCNITGHSMEPRISHGDVIAIREVPDWRDYLPLGEVYAIVTANSLRTVKIVRRGSDPDHLRLVPINTADFDEQEIPRAQILRIFSVLAVIKRL